MRGWKFGALAVDSRDSDTARFLLFVIFSSLTFNIKNLMKPP